MHFLRAMVLPTGNGMSREVSIVVGPRALLVGAFALAVVLLPRQLVIGRLFTSGRTRFVNPLRIAELAILPITLLLVLSSQFSPFLYFRF